jgi:hypothetical protein
VPSNFCTPYQGWTSDVIEACLGADAMTKVLKNRRPDFGAGVAEEIA